MDAAGFDRLAKVLATIAPRRRLVRLLMGLPLAGLLSCVGTATEARGRKAHHQHVQHRHRQTKRKAQRDRDAWSEACIPTGQRCPSRKPRGKKGKKLSCDRCCQGSFVTDATGKRVCSCRPNGGACTSVTASSCCSGFCDGTTCQAAPCSATHPCPQCQTCGTDGRCAPLSDGTICDDGNVCTQNDSCQAGVCVSGTPVPDGTSCGSDQICCGGGCLSGVCCSNAGCASTPVTPICDASHICVACTDHSQCGPDHICLSNGSCQACNVTCPSGSDPLSCGASLQLAMSGGGTVYVCPGRYVGGFNLATPALALMVIGAGDGTDPASNTILDGNGTLRVLNIVFGDVELQRLRITRGFRANDKGAGILHNGTTLRMMDCTVADNTGHDTDGVGIYANVPTTLEMTRCGVRDNIDPSFGFGGGIFSAGTTTLTDCRIEGNRNSVGGGLYVIAGVTTLAGHTTVQGNSISTGSGAGGGAFVATGARLDIAKTCSVTLNTAPSVGDGGGINNRGTVNLQDNDPSIVVNNCHDNCAGTNAVPGCAATPISC